MGENQHARLSRRAVLAAATTTGALAGIGGVRGVEKFRRVQATEIALDGAVSGWVGRTPQSIAGMTNPALSLDPGVTYRVTWTNADGVPHSFVVEDSDGNPLVETDIVSERGATQTVEFEATPAMAEYYCEVHPQTMRGTVAVESGGATSGGGETGEETATGTETTADDETTRASERPPVLDETTVVLGAQVGYWLGLTPAGIRGRPNPTLRLRAGREYDLVWVNLDGVEHDFHVADASGEDLADTSDRDGVGETHETSFEATPAMAEYFCAFHPQSMRGGVEVVTGEGLVRR
ncbi:MULTISPECIES: cupredoxin domain-containing protein [Halorussus]|uniref:cupredoxin domain-containing protein n=1 Tax=Halorussus TaxID=1070314 RepID=UPI0020A0983E|nr:plastocyanin/azurin family copper-binding protein [Halorussus vallis]USZ74442.1 plastocyanin/azurin family copper-binding protein [Halorussus vallis]